MVGIGYVLRDPVNFVDPVGLKESSILHNLWDLFDGSEKVYELSFCEAYAATKSCDLAFDFVITMCSGNYECVDTMGASLIQCHNSTLECAKDKTCE